MNRSKKIYILLGVLLVVCVATFGVSRYEEYKEKISEKRKRLEELKEKYKNITESKGIINKRIENAFPKLKINTRKTFRELIEEIKSNKE